MYVPSRPDQRVRVFHIITRMVRGGAQENTLASAAGLDPQRWDSTLVTGPSDGPEGSLEPECERLRVRTLKIPELVREIAPAADMAALKRLTQLFRRERPDIVHTHTSKAGILGRIAARRAQVPIVVHTPHGHVFHSYGSFIKSRSFAGIERGCAGWADKLVALTPKERDEHLDLKVGHSAQWEIIHSGIDFSHFEPWLLRDRDEVRQELGLPLGVPIIGCVGRLVPIKDQGTLIDAFALAAPKLPGAQLVLVGDGPLHDELVARTQAHGLRTSIGEPSGRTPAPPDGTPTVHFFGLRRDVPRYLRALDVFALCSLNEGMGRVLVETMSMELPCVATWVSGIPDVVDEGKTGLLIPPRAPDMVAGAIRHLFAHESRAREFGRRGREKALQGYSQQAMLDQIESLYLNLLEERGLLPEANTRHSQSTQAYAQVA